MGVIEEAEANGYEKKTGIWRSVRQPISVPQDLSVDVIEWYYRMVPDEEVGHLQAMVDVETKEEMTFGELKRNFQAVSAGLAQLGIGKGDVVLLLAPNSVWFPVTFLGILAAGAIGTTVNPVYTTSEIAKQLKDSGARLIITTAGLYNKVESLGLPVVLMGAQGSALPKGTIPYSTLVSADFRRAPKVRRQQTDTAALLYSSGTTGFSKGVVLTHANFIAVIQQLLLDHPEQRQGRKYLVVLPMFHVYGLAVVTIVQFFRKSSLVIMPKFDATLLLKVCEEYGVTDLPVVPPILIFLAKSPEVDRYDLSQMVEITTGAAPAGKDLLHELQRRLPHGYGMTETSGIVCVSIGEKDLSHFGSSGTVVSSMEVKFVDTSTGKALPPYEQGEIWVRGPNVMTEYLNNRQASAETIDNQRWLHTGDLGYIDKRGQIFIVDRLKELIKYKGLQVAPAELEAILLTHPQIIDAAVVGLPDEKAGEIPIAFVVKSPKSNLIDTEVMAFVSAQVSPYKQLRRVTFISVIPKSASGKILRRELMQKALSSKL